MSNKKRLLLIFVAFAILGGVLGIVTQHLSLGNATFTNNIPSEYLALFAPGERKNFNSVGSYTHQGKNVLCNLFYGKKNPTEYSVTVYKMKLSDSLFNKNNFIEKKLQPHYAELPQDRFYSEIPLNCRLNSEPIPPVTRISVQTDSLITPLFKNDSCAYYHFPSGEFGIFLNNNEWAEIFSQNKNKPSQNFPSELMLLKRADHLYFILLNSRNENTDPYLLYHLITKTAS